MHTHTYERAHTNLALSYTQHACIQGSEKDKYVYGTRARIYKKKKSPPCVRWIIILARRRQRQQAAMINERK